MANTFKNTTVYVTGSPTGLSSSSNTTIVIIGASVTNTGTSNATLSGRLLDSSASSTAYFLGASIPPGGNIAFIGGDQKVVLEPSDQILFTSNVAGALNVVISYMEIS